MAQMIRSITLYFGCVEVDEATAWSQQLCVFLSRGWQNKKAQGH